MTATWGSWCGARTSATARPKPCLPCRTNSVCTLPLMKQPYSSTVVPTFPSSAPLKIVLRLFVFPTSLQSVFYGASFRLPTFCRLHMLRSACLSRFMGPASTDRPAPCGRCSSMRWCTTTRLTWFPPALAQASGGLREGLVRSGCCTGRLWWTGYQWSLL